MAYTILVVDDEENARKPLEALLTKIGYDVALAATMAEAREKLQHGIGDVVVVDVQLPDGYGPNLLLETSRMPNPPPMIMITARRQIEEAVDAMRNGAMDFLLKPLDFDRLEQAIQRACDLVAMRRELAHFRQMQAAKNNFVAGASPAIPLGTLTRPTVKWARNGRSSFGNPRRRNSSSRSFCKDSKEASCPAIPIHMIRGRAASGTAPNPPTSRKNGGTAAVLFAMTSEIISTSAAAIAPKNFKVRWIPSERTQRTAP